MEWKWKDFMFEQEIAFFNSRKPELLKHYEGKFALVKGEHLAGVYDTPQRAYEVGLDTYGLDSFLVRRITKEDEEYHNVAEQHGLMHARI